MWTFPLHGPDDGVTWRGLFTCIHVCAYLCHPYLSLLNTVGYFTLSIIFLQLDINTVAAGGGSVLTFRAGLFVVGPESAGASPGPACYSKSNAACTIILYASKIIHVHLHDIIFYM